ncbi:hypothetical protein DVH05_011620 [Phytophthora capsici]|nr:hypothetical protein DVH05_011620 [Phytophthora capsici]
MKFETHILSNRLDNGSSSQQQQRGNLPVKWTGKQENAFSDGTNKSAATSSQGETAVSKSRADQGDRKNKGHGSGVSRHVRSYFKCSDLTHSVFQCPQVTGFAEANQLYEAIKGKKARPEKTVGIVRLRDSTHTSLRRTLTCRVMDSVDTIIKPDSGAEVSMIAPCLVEKLKPSQVWLPRRNLIRLQVVKGVGPTPITITEETNLYLRFETPGGPLVLRNVSCLISPDPLPDRVGDILLSDSVKERLGYDPIKLIESARRAQPEYDPSDLGATDGDADVYAFGIQKTYLMPEEKGLREAEDGACFPVPNAANSDVGKVKAALREGIEDAKSKGASPEFLEEVQKLLEDHIDVFRMALGGDPPVNMPPMRI